MVGKVFQRGSIPNHDCSWEAEAITNRLQFQWQVRNFGVPNLSWKGISAQFWAAQSGSESIFLWPGMASPVMVSEVGIQNPDYYKMLLNIDV